MKKTLLAATIFGFLSPFVAGDSHAYSQWRDSGDMKFQNLESVLLQKENRQELDAAIERRYYNFYKKHFINNGDYKSRTNQQMRHNYGRWMGRTNDRSTIPNREGELKTVNEYNERRPNSQKSLVRSNSKQTFRARAIDYYVDGGDANTAALQSNVILGSEHKVPRFDSAFEKREKKSEIGEITAEIRDVQRSRKVSEKVPTGQQKNTYRKGASYRNFVHPYMFGSQSNLFDQLQVEMLDPAIAQ